MSGSYISTILRLRFPPPLRGAPEDPHPRRDGRSHVANGFEFAMYRFLAFRAASSAKLKTLAASWRAMA